VAMVAQEEGSLARLLPAALLVAAVAVAVECAACAVEAVVDFVDDVVAVPSIVSMLSASPYPHTHNTSSNPSFVWLASMFVSSHIDAGSIPSPPIATCSSVPAQIANGRCAEAYCVSRGP